MSTLPLELRLRGKSTTLSRRAPIYYVDLTLRGDTTLAQAVAAARTEWDARKAAGMDQAALAMIQVNWHFGYWLALLALIAAAAMAWLVMSGKEAEAEAKMRALAADATDAAKGAAAKASDAIDAAKDKKDDEPPKAP